jgi:type VI secretion system protein ImpF
VLRDLAWLLNTVNYQCAHSLDDYPFVARSVLNYGLPELTGRVVADMTPRALEALVEQAILDFEPRILPNSLRVRATISEDQMNRNAVGFEIEGDLWAYPMPLHLLVKTEIDGETGHVSFGEGMGETE